MRPPFPLLFAVCALTVALPAAAQTSTVTGSIVDDRTEQPIRNALVYVDGHPVFAHSDSEGRFALALPAGDYTITASMVGYALLRAEITVVERSIVPVTFRLSEGAGSYTDRVTVAGARRTASDDAPGAGALY